MRGPRASDDRPGGRPGGRAARALVAACLAAGASLAGGGAGLAARAQDAPPAPPREEPRVFERALEDLLAAIEEACPRVAREVGPITLGDLGWGASDGGPEPACRRLVLVTPAGLSRPIGLVARRGCRGLARLEPRRHPAPDRLLAVGPDLVVVEGPRVPPAALTLEAREREGALLAAAWAPIAAWQRPDVPAPRGADVDMPWASNLTAYPHLLTYRSDEGEPPSRKALARFGACYDRTHARLVLATD